MFVCFNHRGERYNDLLIPVNLSISSGNGDNQAVRVELGNTEAMVLLKNVDSVFTLFNS
jgi:hypothetical protein